MGRPKEHNAKTAAALLDAAERIVHADGLEGLSVRRVASDVGTTTRAVYSLFGSKDALVAALGRRAFELLGTAIEGHASTADPAADLVGAGVAVFRDFAVRHPSLFALAVQRTMTSPRVAADFAPAASQALRGLTVRVARVEGAGLRGGRSVRDAVCAFHALCEGLAAVELRGVMPPGREKQIWTDALAALVAGFAVPPS